MAVAWALESQSHSASVSSDGKPVLAYKEKYLWTNDSGSFVGCNATRLSFQSSTGIIPGSGYGDNPFAICRSVVVTKLPTKPPHQKWEVEVDWSTETPAVDEENPANRRWVREVSDSEQQRFIVRDRNNKLIVDTAGTPFDGGVPVNVRLTTYNWEHNVDWSVYNLNTIGELSGKLNADTFLGKDPYTLLLTYRAKEQWEGKYHFAAETYTMIYDPLGWRPKPVNAGLYEIDRTKSPPSRKRIQIKGKDATEPEPLDLAGKVIPSDRRPQDCIFVTVDYYDAISFSSLGLPTT